MARMGLLSCVVRIALLGAIFVGFPGGTSLAQVMPADPGAGRLTRAPFVMYVASAMANLPAGVLNAMKSSYDVVGSSMNSVRTMFSSQASAAHQESTTDDMAPEALKYLPAPSPTVVDNIGEMAESLRLQGIMPLGDFFGAWPSAALRKKDDKRGGLVAPSVMTREVPRVQRAGRLVWEEQGNKETVLGDFDYCAPGHYCPFGDDIRASMACPNGTFRSEWDASALQDCDVCPAGYTCDVATSEPVSCPAGGYCPEGKSFRACPLGTFNPYAGQSNFLACKQCPAGYVCDKEGATAFDASPCPGGTIGAMPGAKSSKQCATCPAGKFCQGRGIQIRNCPRGAYCPAGSTTPIACPANTFCATGSKAPETCPAGSMCEFAASAPVPCPAGGFCPKGEAFTPCPRGTYNSAAGQDSIDACVTCPIGYVCGSEGTARYETSPCPAGTFGSQSGAKSFADCATCPAGTFCPGGGNQVKKCLPGTYCPSGVTAPIVCPAGSMCKSSASEPVACPAGGFCPEGKVFTRCPRGTYNPAAGQGDIDACMPCPAGYVCNYEGVTRYDESPCPAGTFGAKPGATSFASCATCPAGKFCPEGGTKQPRKCPPGTYCPAGATEPTTCPADTVCTAGSPAPKPCPGGAVCELGTSKPVPCPAAGFCSEGSPFTPCPRGTCNPKVGQASIGSCLPCPAGFVCASEGTAFREMMPCPAGTSSAIVGATRLDACRLCAGGYFCGGASNQPRICPAGMYCPEGATLPMRCPFGTLCLKGTDAPAYWPLWVIVLAIAILSVCYSGYLPLLWPQPSQGHVVLQESFLPACTDQFTCLRVFHMQRKHAAGVITRWVRTTPKWQSFSENH